MFFYDFDFSFENKKKENVQEFQRDFISPPSIGMFAPVI